EVRARRLDSELDSLLKLTDDAGNILASNDDFLDEGAGLITHQADSLIAFMLPKDATYFVHVSDTRIHGGEAYGYRLRISPPRPDFSLRIAPSSINARPGMTVPLTVYALRQDGFNGRIDLALSEMPADFSLSGGWISAGKDKVQLSLTVPGIASEEPVSLQVAGRAKIRGRMVERIAVPADDMMQAFLYRHLVPMREALVSVQGRERRGQVVRILDSLPVKLPVGQTSQIHIAAPKGPFIDRLQLELRDPPQGFSIQKVLPHPRGITILLDLQGEGIQSEQQGNLIIEVFVSPPGNVKGGRQANRRVSLGILPAIPYETVAISDAS
ncbi:MAG: hypothetical protein L0Z07_00460, partial [Planctomycetes bacterium]|nr:hypothetical protein [Planctomycetota bacterium]